MTDSPTQFAIRPDWLDQHAEEALAPAVPMLDAHHHLYERPGLRYLLEDYSRDAACGHDLQASVFVQARAMLRAKGPEALRPVGEVEFATGMAAMAASGLYGPVEVAAAIIGQADLSLGDAVRPVLTRMKEVAGARMRGIRHPLAWDVEARLLNPAYPSSADMTLTQDFRRGFACLADLGLSFEVWAFYPQMPAIADLARAFPSVPIVVNHCGGVVRVLHHAANPEMGRDWLRGLAALAACPNVLLKVSGLGMRLSGFGFELRPTPPTSELLAETWRPWVQPCLDLFGADRCMWGSNFPVDKGSYAMGVGINAFKRLLEGATPTERAAVLGGTAARHYGIAL